MGEEKRSPEKEKKHHKSRHKLRKIEAMYEGPIPPPAHFRDYESVLPGAADRILSMAEQERKDRQKNTRTDIKLYYTSKILSKILFTTICLATLIIGAYLVSNGHGLTGIASILGGLGTIAGGFFYSKRQNKKDSE